MFMLGDYGKDRDPPFLMLGNNKVDLCYFYYYYFFIIIIINFIIIIIILWGVVHGRPTIDYGSIQEIGIDRFHNRLQ